jgi:hypothetical protein
MKPEERDAVIEECAKVCDEWARARKPMRGGWALENCANAIRALTAQSPAGVPPEPTDVSPGGYWRRIVPDDSAGVPTTEPVAPIAREPTNAMVVAGLHVMREWGAKPSAVLASRIYIAMHDAAPQAPAEPVAQEPFGWFTEWSDPDTTFHRRREVLDAFVADGRGGVAAGCPAVDHPPLRLSYITICRRVAAGVCGMRCESVVQQRPESHHHPWLNEAERRCAAAIAKGYGS